MATLPTDLLGYLLTVIAGVIAMWQAGLKNKAKTDVQNVVAFYDPADETVQAPPPLQTPGVTIPARSWIMNDSTKNWVLQGHSESTKGEILAIIDEKEKAHQTHYVIPWKDPGRGEDGYYIIDFGLLMGGGKGEYKGGS